MTDDRDRQVRGLLTRLQSGERESAWAEFLEAYASVILKVIRHFERNTDGANECFVFICEELARKDFHRLRSFDAEGPATFSTWLRAVTRNLVVDWQRRSRGRRRIFASIARLPLLEQEVYRCVHENGLPPYQTLLLLRPKFPALSEERIHQCLQTIEGSLSPRQMRLLTIHQGLRALEGADRPGSDCASIQIPDPAPGPEAETLMKEQLERLGSALSSLPAREQVMIRLRYEGGLSLTQLAGITGLGTPQQADFRIRKIIARLRELIK